MPTPGSIRSRFPSRLQPVPGNDRRWASRAIRALFLTTFALALLAGRAFSAPADSPASGSLLVVTSIKDADKHLAELLDLRRGQGWEVSTLIVESRTTPSAVVPRIAEAKNRNPRLTHLLLVGSDKSLPIARLPRYRVQANESPRPFATDDVYGLPDDRGVPALAVGRIPADDPDQLRAYVSKAVRYEKNADSLSRELVALIGRQPSSDLPVVGSISPQKMWDSLARAYAVQTPLRYPRLKATVRTAFPGPGYFAYDEGPAVLEAAFARRPLALIYCGHAGRGDFATFHARGQTASIATAHVAGFENREVCGPFFSCGCSMLDPDGSGRSIGEAIVLHPGGPVAFVGYTATNDDFVVDPFGMWSFAFLTPGRTTLGEIVLTAKRTLATRPQSFQSKAYQAVLNASGFFRPGVLPLDYPRLARKNAAMIMLCGDPTATMIIP